MRFLALSILFFSACETSPGVAARVEFNKGVKALAAGTLDDAEKRFAKAINESGPDPELRYRAALNLGLTYTRASDAAEKPEEKLGKLRQAANWFRDATRLRQEDNKPRKNLEIVLRRIQILVDQLDKFRGLKPRLDKLIANQRSLYDGILKLIATLDQRGASDPTGFEDAFAELATLERTLLAEARTVSELAADEAQLIEDKPEEQRSAEDSGKLIQLKNLEYYLSKARSSLADTRRELRKLGTTRAITRAGVALEDLKRAREQLLDPIAVLRAIVEEQLLVLQQTAVLHDFKTRTVTHDESAAPPQKLPSWLTGAHLAAREEAINLRLTELAARFQSAENSEPPADADAKTKRMLEMAKLAAPHLEEAKRHVKDSMTALTGKQLERAQKAEESSLLAMFSAIELFADIKNLVELTYASQAEAVTLLSPEKGAEAEKLSTKELTAKLSELVRRNRDRLARLKGLFEDELAALAQPPQTQPPHGANAQPSPQAPSPEEAEQKKKLFELAESFRADSLAAVESLASIVSGSEKGDAKALSKEALKKLHELRRLFFNVVEHLEELIAEAEETRDQVAGAQALSDDKRLEKFGPLVDRQTRHSAAGVGIADALAQMADQAAANPQPPEAGPPPKFAEAAEEVRAANPFLAGAEQELKTAREQSSTMSVSLEPVMEDQDKALEFLRRALELLKPPKEKQEQDQDEPQEEDSKQQDEQRLQEAREREAKRRREKKKQQASLDEVEKDW